MALAFVQLINKIVRIYIYTEFWVVLFFFSFLSWDRPDLGNVSGMTFHTVQLPTGYVVDRDEVERLYADRERYPGMLRIKLFEWWLFFVFEWVSMKTGIYIMFNI